MKKILFFAIALVSAAMFTACNDTKTPDGDKNKLWASMEDPGNLYGFINASGKFVIEPQYARVGSFSCGWILVQEKGENGKIKFIDKNNRSGMEIDPDNLADYCFYYDRLTFKDGEKYGKYDNKFNVAVAPDYKYLDVTADNGYSRFSTEEGKAGYVDKNGKIAIEAKFNGAGDFADGIAVASELDGDDNIIVGVINAKGKYVIEPKKDRRYWNLGEGRLSYREGEDYKRGLLDKNGNVLLEPKYDYMYPFSCGLALVETDRKYAFINTKGQEVLSDYYSATSFVEDMAWVMKDEDSKIELIDKRGNVLLTLEEDERPNDFHNGLALITTEKWENTKAVITYSYINKSGKVIYSWKHEYGFEWAPKHETLFEQSMREMKTTEKGYLFNQDFEVVR